MITLNCGQADGVRRITQWHRHDTEDQQTFFVSGYAGTGKSTTLGFAIAELGLPAGSVVYATFTMKAALVLRRNGLPCTTIHKAIYSPVEQSEQAYQAACAELADIQNARPVDMPVALWRRRVRDLEQQIADIRSIKFEINEKSKVRDCRLVVLDEVSMVNEEMADDILAFDKPVLVLGDPGQLPPIRGQSPFASRTPDVMLTEIHRQAAESPIIYLATLARQGERIPFGHFGSTVHKLRDGARTAAELLEADQVICGKHVTRRRFNNELRLAAGFPDPLPTGQGEKIIGLKNEHALGLFNGQFMTLSNVGPVDGPANDLAFKADILTEDGTTVEQRRLYRGWYDDHVAFDKKREERDCFKKRNLVETDWGYAITCHKAQGSGFNAVVVVDDGFGFWDQRLRAQWLYTAITRAADTLTILA
jgi:exodeoxyribonuclease-5